MKKIASLIALCLMFCTGIMAQSFIYGKKGGSLGHDAGTAMVSDNNNNVYIAGYFADSIRFGNMKVTGLGVQDIFVVKLDPSGNAIWLKRFGGNKPDEAHAIAIDYAGNLYLTGFAASDTAYFDTVKVACVTKQIFVAKLNSNGDCIWSKQAGANNYSEDIGKGIGVDTMGNVYVTGNFRGTANFGNGITVTSVLNPGFGSPSVDAFTAKYNSSGVCQWVKTGGSYQDEYGNAIAVDKAGNAYVVGLFMNNAVFSGVTISAPAGRPDGFIATYGTAGTLTSLKKITSTDYEACKGITLDGQGHFYITGITDGNTLFDSIQIQNNGNYDMFLAKYTINGTVRWVRTTQGDQWEEGRQVRCDAEGNVYIAGDFYAFGTTPFPPYPFPGVGSFDILIAKYNRHGEFQWAQRGGSVQDDYAFAIATTDSGKVYFTGSYEDNLTLGNTYLPNYTGPGGWTDMFYAKVRTDITTGNPPSSTYCAGTSFSLTFVAHQAYKPTNVFTAQISDANGRFDNAINIGTLNTNISSSIFCTIPTTVPFGIGYRVRVIASDTLSFGNDNGTDITINTAPVVSLTANDYDICTGDSATLTTPHYNGNNYKWYYNNAFVNGAVTNVYFAKQTGNYKVRVTNSFGCSVASPNKLITVNNYPTASITASGPLTYCSTDSVILTASSGVGYAYQWRKGTATVANATKITFKPVTSGTYRVLVTNAAGCSTLSSSKKITILKPVAQISADSTTFCAGDSLDLKAFVNNTYTYQWIKGLNNIANATLPTYYAKSTGTYKVLVTDSNGCSLTSNKITIYAVGCRDVENFVGYKTIQIFPVPAQQYFEIETSISEKVMEAILTSATGQVVEKWYNETKINCDHIPSGIYILTVVTGNAVYKNSLVITH